ncbi:MAG TPA: hypothetical protein PK765_01535 [bacterium]|nr:hypothetical protein [bacterium]
MKKKSKSKRRYRLRREDIIHVGLDNLELYFSNDDALLFDFEKDLNVDGSPEGDTVIHGMRFKYSLGFAPSGYAKSMKFFLLENVYDRNVDALVPEAFNVFSIFWGDDNPDVKIRGRNKVVFHSTFFMYMERFIGVTDSYSWLYDFIVSNFRIDFSRSHLHRFDICVDIANLEKCDLIPRFDSTHFSGHIGKIKDQPGYFETDYIKRKSSDKNRNYLIRIYDKIEDTRVKGKWALFGHLNQYDAVTRMEIEFRSDFCDVLTNPTPEGEVFDLENDLYTVITAMDLLLRPGDLLGSIFLSKISKYTKLFDSVSGWQLLAFRPYEKSESDLERQYLRLAHIPRDYMSRFLGYARSILEKTSVSGYCQAFLGVLIEDKPTNARTNKKIASSLIRSPEILIREVLRYACVHLPVDRLKLNRVLREFIFTPKIKLHAKQKDFPIDPDES